MTIQWALGQPQDMNLNATNTILPWRYSWNSGGHRSEPTVAALTPLLGSFP